MHDIDRPSLLVQGALPEPTLRRILYSGWRVDTLSVNRNGRIVAVVSCDPDIGYGFGPAFQAARIRSLGTVGVGEYWEDADLLAAVLALYPSRAGAERARVAQAGALEPSAGA